MTFEQFQDKFKANTQRLTAQKELDVWKIKQEYKAIHNFYIDRGKIFKNKYEEARYKILKWIITCATNDTEEIMTVYGMVLVNGHLKILV